jgi:transposase-like protein
MVQRLVEERFLEMQEAYETLSDDAGRSEYDAALAALRSEGEYYIPVAPNSTVQRKGPERCDKCRTMVSEPTHYICEGCRKEIAALEKEVRARRQPGITACMLCGASKRPLDGSPLGSGLCLKCWGNIAKEVRRRYAEDRLVVCPQCGRIREAGRDCPRCGQNSVGGGTWWSWKQSIAGMWKPAAGWSMVYLALRLTAGYWQADFFIFITLAVIALYSFIKWAFL